MKSLFSLIFFLCLSSGFSLKNQTIVNKGDLYVSNDLQAEFLHIIGLNSFLTCENLQSSSLISNEFDTAFVKGNNLYVKNIYPNTGNATYVKKHFLQKNPIFK